ncbi:MAG: hypothetical protein RLY21_2112 [Planctomycetota bacterium]|jgi:hypothetical protein
MTRMAPKPAEYARRTTDPAAASASLRWRIGRNGSLTVTVGRIVDDIEQHGDGDSGSLAVRIELHRGLAAARAMPAPEAASEVVSGRANPVGDSLEEASEQRLSIALFRGASPVRAELAVVERGSAPPVVLTDLPAQLGLRGGTYSLDAGTIAAFAATLHALLGETR